VNGDLSGDSNGAAEAVMGAGMPTAAKFLIGLAAAWVAGWVSHGPLGQGAAFVNRMEAQAKAVVRESQLPGVEVRFARNPLKREAILSGTANDFQREGMGLLPGLNDRIRDVPGVASVRWEE
jgi:hypothetical protein